MDSRELQGSVNQVCTEQHQSVADDPSQSVAVSINVQGGDALSIAMPDLQRKQMSNQEPEAIHQNISNLVHAASRRSPTQSDSSGLSYSIVISMPDSPSGIPFGTKRVLFNHEAFAAGRTSLPPFPPPTSNDQPANHKTHPQPVMMNSAENKINFDGAEHQPRMFTRNDSTTYDKRFDSFKTWSGRLERQLSNLRGRPIEPVSDAVNFEISNEIQDLPVDRYFDALEGPELDTLKASEELVLPEHEQWPFLLRFPISSFGICLGVGSQAMLWKTLATAPSVSFLHVHPTINLVLWWIAIALLVTVSSIYLLKFIFYFEAVRREYYHPVRINFFFAPWIACLFLALGVPPSIAVHLRAPLWYALMAPILCLELKIYGQWMSGGQRRLSKVANPSNHLSIVGNFVGALLGAKMGLKEGPIFFFAVGLAHYIVLFVTLYQRLPTNETLPKELHPVFFLFVAAPSVASTAWAMIRGDFEFGSKIAYFIALFLYLSLVVRVNFFRGFRFSLAWWAYTFPMTAAAMATIRYATELTSPVTQFLAVGLSVISTFTVTVVLISTMLHAFVFKNLFPNDILIAISRKKKKKSSKKRSQNKSSGSSQKDRSLSGQDSV